MFKINGKVMIRVFTFESKNGSIGKQIDAFLEEKQRKLGSLFKLIDIKYAMGAHYVGDYSFTSALVIFDDGKVINENEN